MSEEMDPGTFSIYLCVLLGKFEVKENTSISFCKTHSYLYDLKVKKILYKASLRNNF